MNIKFHFSDRITEEQQNNLKNEVLELVNKYDYLKEGKIVFTFGGDGTFIDAFAKYQTEYTYVPINFGNLGFYTSWSFDNFEDIFTKQEQNTMLYAPLLNVSLTDCNGDTQQYKCVNESTITNMAQTQIADIYINEFYPGAFRGTGICLSTPTGSTAYNKSLQGAIIDPSKKLFQLTKIAPISNNSYPSMSNPVILDSYDKVTITPIDEDYANSFENSILTMDRENIKLTDIAKLEFTLSETTIKILHNKEISFWERIKKAFL